MKTALKILLLTPVWLTMACRSDRVAAPSRDARSCYEQALEAFDQDSVRMGEQLLNEAVSRARREKDSHTLYLAQLRLAESLAWGNSAEALDMAKQALESYQQKPDSPRNLIILLDYIGTYASQVAFNGDEQYDEALDYARRAYDLAVASQDTLGTELVSQTLTSLANIHWAMGAYGEALHDAREAAACSPDHLKLGAQQVLARCLVSCDSLAEAEAVYRAMQPGDDLQASYIVQSNLAKLALRRSDIESAEEAIDEAFGHAEDLYFKALQQKDDYYRNALVQERENERLRYTAALHRRMLWGGIALLLILLTATLLVVRSEVAKRKQQVRLRQQERLIHHQQLARHENELRMRDGTVAFLQDFILQRTEVIQKVGKASKRHINISPHEWEEMERTLNAIDGNRIAYLRQHYPELKEEDIQLCILIRLHLTNRAIGNIYGLTISAVQHRKQKLKKEVFGEDDPDTPLELVIERIQNESLTNNQ